MPSSIRRLTQLDHERLARLLHRMCTPGPSQARWRADFVGLISAHRIAEREVVLVDVIGRPSLAAAARDQAAADVDLDRVVERVRALPLDSTGLDPDNELEGLRTDLAAQLSQHATLWQERLMGPLETEATRSEMRQLGGRYEQHRDGALADSGTTHAPPRRLDLSRAELYELARNAGIEGRSSMTRRELIDELQSRSRAV